MHILLLLKLYKAITPWFSSFAVCDHFDLLDGSVSLEFTAELGFAGVEINARHKKGAERVGGTFGIGLGVP